ncbi:MAG TPA: endonuclease [Chloroflexia bacterium]|nr:endonuclease [Chloroflexia bacterium]
MSEITGAGWPPAGHAHDRALLTAIYRTLLARYGPQGWWPTVTGSRWEVMLGAVLVQRTTWRNADRALANLRSALGREALSDPAALLEAPDERLVEVLRPAGHFNRKPRTLKLLARLVQELGGVEALALSNEPAADLRTRLLGTWGIGPETADAILLYALGRPVFVADAYALRLGTRWGLLEPNATYDEVQRTFGDNLPVDAALFNEYHALIVEHGKQLCSPLPLCDLCPLSKAVVLNGGEHEASWRCPRRYVERAGKEAGA